ncbi:hypothetical protein EFN63_00845 [Leuconostoc citreum]|uniref:Phage-Barnase-EndoU-ColicinE5/D-RelE like nuclease 4 domain-containing protein n=1 Tax=Leuconostoc citreum TaxID=33964 RepID=A0A5A5U6L3_LEUCI|nr:PBECR4 domain-containing protein [Leuconostoc citreum]MCT3066922.1 hypothetical protein [Leuconostoc citreum]GDZ84735.1 hypothetical protein LCIT_19770 [Leuconostoc citreum]GDZ86577.1 hypothetical protein LCTS_17760 [Leuconostoc citreum]
MLDSTVPFQISDIRNAYSFIKSLDGRKLVYIYLKNNKLCSLVFYITVYNLLHLTGLSYYNKFDKPGRFIKDLERKRINIDQLGEKPDGSTRLKLVVLPLLEYIVYPGVKVSDNRIVLDGHSFSSSLYVRKSLNIRSAIMLGEDCTNMSQRYLFPESLYNYKSIGSETRKKIGNTCKVLGLFSPSEKDSKLKFMSVYFISEHQGFTSDDILNFMSQVNKKLQ